MSIQMDIRTPNISQWMVQAAHSQKIPPKAWKYSLQCKTLKQHQQYCLVLPTEVPTFYIVKWFLYECRIQLLVYRRVPILRFSIKATAAPFRSDFQEGFRCIGSQGAIGCPALFRVCAPGAKVLIESGIRYSLLLSGSMLAQLCSSEFWLYSSCQGTCRTFVSISNFAAFQMPFYFRTCNF